MMRYFTHEWASLEDDSEAERVVETYHRFIASLPGESAEHIRAFVAQHSLQGALLDRLTVFLPSNRIEFTLISGDIQLGYSKLTIKYLDAQIIEASSDKVTAAMNRRSAVLRYDEFDVSPSIIGGMHTAFIHRFLLWPRHLGTFAIKFSCFEIVKEAIDRRRYDTYGATFVIARDP